MDIFANFILPPLVMLLIATGIIPARAIDLLERATQIISQRRKLLLISFPVLSLIVNSAVAFKDGLPIPQVQDEYSYLLAADTFGHGRITNPTPRFWEHFETMHELMQPTYMSKYPPGQAIALALGQRIVGTPIAGVWITTAIACGTIYWMLLAFVPNEWALLGGLIAVCHPLLLQWSQIYWGGSVAVLGGAIVIGAWRRLLNQPRRRAAILLGIGLGILANSRPFEGLAAVMPLMLILLWRLAKTMRQYAFSIILTMVAVLMPVVAAMMYYNFRINHNPLQMPFLEYSKQYDVYPKFFLLPKRPIPVFRNEPMRQIHMSYERGAYDQLRTFSGFAIISVEKMCKLIAIHTQPFVLLIPLLAAIVNISKKHFLPLWLSVISLLIAILAENFFIAHYAAPVSAAILLLIVLGWQRLSSWTWRGNAFGMLASRALITSYFVAALISLFIYASPESRAVGRSAFVNQESFLQTGKHLVFVRYGPDHVPHDEWVYNGAELQSSQIIWARYMGTDSDAPVANYYSGRQNWLVTVGNNYVTCQQYALPR